MDANVRLVSPKYASEHYCYCSNCCAVIEVFHDPEGWWIECECSAGYIEDGAKLLVEVAPDED